jgi:hypothetical protein
MQLLKFQGPLGFAMGNHFQGCLFGLRKIHKIQPTPVKRLFKSMTGGSGST